MTFYRDWPHMEATKHVIDEIGEERARQRNVEKWSTPHDDEHDDGAMARAAATYAGNAGVIIDEAYEASKAPYFAPAAWPWDRKWWKPKNRRRDLVKAAALIVAEIERLDRLSAKQS